MRFLSKTFIRGLMVLLPVALTLYIVYWLGSSAEATLGKLLQRLLPESTYFFGMGMLAGTILIFAIGLLTRVWLARKFGAMIDTLLEKLPLFKTLYSSIRDLFGLFSGDSKDQLGQVVSVEFEFGQFSMLGFVTRENFDDMSDVSGGEGRVAVFLPMSYQVGGFTLMLPKSALTPVDMTVEECMKFAMTAGVGKKAPSQ